MEADEIYRRAGGRRRYNRQRQAEVALRHWELRRVLRAYPDGVPLDQSLVEWVDQVAAHLGVSRATVYRDLRSMNARRGLQLRRELAASRCSRLADIQSISPTQPEWIDFEPWITDAIDFHLTKIDNP